MNIPIHFALCKKQSFVSINHITVYKDRALYNVCYEMYNYILNDCNTPRCDILFDNKDTFSTPHLNHKVDHYTKATL